MYGLVETVDNLEDVYSSDYGEIITIYTLVDITISDIAKYKPEDIPIKTSSGIVWDMGDYIRAKNQQANFSTLIQTVSIKANPLQISTPRVIKSPVAFGSKYKSIKKCWTVSFTLEHEGFYTNHDPFDLLLEDLEGVPIILGLTESKTLKEPQWCTFGSKCNMVIRSDLINTTHNLS